MRNNNQQKLFDAVPIKDIEGRGQRVLLKDIPAPYREEFLEFMVGSTYENLDGESAYFVYDWTNFIFWKFP